MEYIHSYRSIEVKAEIDIFENFFACEEFSNTPFAISKTILSDELDLNFYEQKVIRCKLDEENVRKLIQKSEKPQAACVEIIEYFANKNWLLKDKRLFKTLTCNQSESQFMYLVEK